MKELRNTELFGNGKLLGYRTDNGVIHVTVNYKNGHAEYITLKSPGSGNKEHIKVSSLDEVIRILLTIRKELH